MKPLTIKIMLYALAVIFVLTSCAEQNELEGASESLTESIEENLKQSSAQKSDPGEMVDKKLDGLLITLVKNAEKNLPKDSQKIDSQLSIKNDKVSIEVTYYHSQVTQESLNAFKKLGGQVDTVFQNKLYGRIAIDKIRQAAEPDAVWTISAATKVAYPAVDTDSSDKVDSGELKPGSGNTKVKGEGTNENK
ncbi:MAG: hypothetical protein V3V31_13555 [Methylococcales bacterium]